MNAPSADTLVEQARYHAHQKDFQVALRCCKEATAIAPHRADIQALLGEYHLELGDFQSGLAAAETAIALAPELAHAYYIRAWARGNLHDFDGEIEDTATAYGLDPNSHELYYRRLARAHAGKGDYRYALTCCHMVLAFNPDDIDLRINRGGLYRILKQYKEAIVDFEQAISLSPEWYVPYYALGLTQIDDGQYGAAVNSLSKALETDPDSHWYPRILAFRAYAYQLSGQLDAAARDCAKARAIDPDVQLYGPPFPAADESASS